MIAKIEFHENGSIKTLEFGEYPINRVQLAEILEIVGLWNSGDRKDALEILNPTARAKDATNG